MIFVMFIHLDWTPPVLNNDIMTWPSPEPHSTALSLEENVFLCAESNIAF